MAKVMLNDTVIAECGRVETVETNPYFPPTTVNSAYLRPSDLKTHCPWKGDASYFDVVVGDKVLRNAAWTYKDPKPAARSIKDHIAFYPDRVTVAR